MKQRLTHNLGLKFLALIIAAFLWFVVSSERTGARAFTLPVSYLLPDELVLTGDPPPSVAVSVRGSELLLSSVDPARLSVPVDLRTSAAGDHRVVLDPVRNLRGIPPALAVESIAPQILTLHSERKLRRAVKVTPLVEGSPPRGCRLARTDAVPSELLVEGPEGPVSNMTAIPTDPIDATGLCQTTILRVEARPAGSEIRLVAPRPVTVTLTIERDDRPAAP